MKHAMDIRIVPLTIRAVEGDLAARLFSTGDKAAKNLELLHRMCPAKNSFSLVSPMIL